MLEMGFWMVSIVLRRDTFVQLLDPNIRIISSDWQSLCLDQPQPSSEAQAYVDDDQACGQIVLKNVGLSPNFR